MDVILGPKGHFCLLGLRFPLLGQQAVGFKPGLDICMGNNIPSYSSQDTSSLKDRNPILQGLSQSRDFQGLEETSPER